MNLVAVGLAVGATLMWGLTMLWMKLGVDRSNWRVFGFLRPWMGLPFIAAYAWATGGFEFGSASLVWVGLAGGLVNAFLGTALFYIALSKGSMHETNILANTSPFWGVVGAIAILGEPARWATFVAGVLVILGTVFLVRRRVATQERASRRPALAAALATGILWGITTTVPTKLCIDGGMSPATYQLLFTVSAAVGWSGLLLPSLLRGRIRIERKDLGYAFLSSFFGLFIGWVLWLAALGHADASALAPLNGLALLFATLLGVLVLRERLTVRILVGGAFTIAGVTLVSVLA